MLGRLKTPSRDLAIDLGTAYTLVYESGQGIVVDEPSVVALDAATGDLLAAGHHAKEMLGRAPGRVSVVRPLVGGVISDADAAERMLRYFIARSRPSRLIRPRVVVCVPSEVTGVERRALEDAAMRAGARHVDVIEEAVAAAVGAGLNVQATQASMVVDIGGGTSDVAVTSLGGVVRSRSVRLGGHELDDAIAAHLKNEYALLLGERTAERIKLDVGSAFPLTEELTCEVRGRDLIGGLPRSVTVTSVEIRRALEPTLLAICDTVRATLDACPPELAGDILDTGIVLTGGGAQLRGLDVRLHHELAVPVRVAADPANAVVLGAGACVENYDLMRGLLMPVTR
ncbi:rod shape-determining protein [Dermacoccus sp. GAS27A]